MRATADACGVEVTGKSENGGDEGGYEGMGAREGRTLCVLLRSTTPGTRAVSMRGTVARRSEAQRCCSCGSGDMTFPAICLFRGQTYRSLLIAYWQWPLTTGADRDKTV